MIDPDNVARDACSILAIICKNKSSAADVSLFHGEAVRIASLIHLASHQQAASINSGQVTITIPPGTNVDELIKAVDVSRKVAFKNGDLPPSKAPNPPEPKPIAYYPQTSGENYSNEPF